MNRIKKIILLITLIFITLSNAFSISVFAAEKADLIQARDNLQAVIDNQDNSLNGNSYYEATSYHSFLEAINVFGGILGIQTLIDDDLAEQNEVDDLVTAINNAIAGLVTYVTYNLVLNNLNQAKSITSNTYTQDSIVLYYAELTRIELILFNPIAGETIIAALNDDIINAFTILVQLADNSDLLETYNELINKDISEYTTNSGILYNLELDRLYDLIVSPNLDSTLSQQIIDDLNIVEDLLVELPDYSALQEAYDSTDEYKEEDYSASSYQAMLDAKSDALYTLSNLNATQTEVDLSETNLLNAIAELSRKIDTIYISEGDQLDINQYITLGQANIINYSIADNEILSVDNTGQVQGIGFGETTVSIELDNSAVEIITIFVKAKPGVAVYVLTFSLPLASIGLGFGMIYVKKDTWKRIFNVTKNLFKRKK
ncbi:hypothetical protein ACAG96_05860 [Candidatus Izemoplasma sp. B36]|uniref:hypothetical protein n=1 Tax=Candidatus Izemoplasma sp. B36 TaxID=3242468 RepID=UPI0035593392